LIFLVPASLPPAFTHHPSHDKCKTDSSQLVLFTGTIFAPVHFSGYPESTKTQVLVLSFLFDTIPLFLIFTGPFLCVFFP